MPDRSGKRLVLPEQTMKLQANTTTYTHMVYHRILLLIKCPYSHVDMEYKGLSQLPLISDNSCYIYSKTTNHLTTGSMLWVCRSVLVGFFCKFSKNFCIIVPFHRLPFFLSLYIVFRPECTEEQSCSFSKGPIQRYQFIVQLRNHINLKHTARTKTTIFLLLQCICDLLEGV